MLSEPFRPGPVPGSNVLGPQCTGSAAPGRPGREADRSLRTRPLSPAGGGSGRAGREAGARQPLVALLPPSRSAWLGPASRSGSWGTLAGSLGTPPAQGLGSPSGAAVADSRGRRAASNGRERAREPARRPVRPFRLLRGWWRPPHPGQPGGGSPVPLLAHQGHSLAALAEPRSLVSLQTHLALSLRTGVSERVCVRGCLCYMWATHARACLAGMCAGMKLPRVCVARCRPCVSPGWQCSVEPLFPVGRSWVEALEVKSYPLASGFCEPPLPANPLYPTAPWTPAGLPAAAAPWDRALFSG